MYWLCIVCGRNFQRHGADGTPKTVPSHTEYSKLDFSGNYFFDEIP